MSCPIPQIIQHNMTISYHTRYTILLFCSGHGPMNSPFLPSYLFPARLTYVVVARFAFLTTRWQGSPSLLPQRIVLGELMSRKGVCVANWSPPLDSTEGSRTKGKRTSFSEMTNDKLLFALVENYMKRPLSSIV